MKRTEKEQLVTELKEKIGGAQALYYTDFTGLNVKRMTELRRRLRKANVEYVVIKNTLALRAVNESGLVGALNGLLTMFAGALDALKSQREGA
jgi:large subunit ribosomal protein L10